MSLLTPRERFIARLQNIHRAGPHRTKRVLRLINDLVDEALDGYCAALADHWRDETGEVRVGSGEEVGECGNYCSVDALDFVGLIEIPVWARCPNDHDWYGDGCPECEEAEAEEAKR